MIKRIITRITLIWLAITGLQQALAQKVCDLQFTQIRYQQNQAIPQGDTVWGALCIKNLGPDTILPGEPVYIRKSVAQVTHNYTGGLAPGDSIRLKLFYLINEEVKDTLFSYCFWKGANTTPYTDPNSANDTVCTTIKLLGKPTGIASQKSQLAFYVYPNPCRAKGTLQILCPESVTTQELELSLYDINGKLIATMSQKVQQETLLMQLDQWALEAGTYFLRISRKGKLLYATPILVAA